jgi:hypothetical protein
VLGPTSLLFWFAITDVLTSVSLFTAACLKETKLGQVVQQSLDSLARIALLSRGWLVESMVYRDGYLVLDLHCLRA